MNKYPTNLKEAIISSVPNCTTMVLTMMTINLFIYGHLTWANFWHALPLIWITAFSLDFFIVGPIVTRIVSKFQIFKLMPFIRVGCMAAVLTFLAPIVESGFIVPWQLYLVALPRNYVLALIFQIFLAMPFGLYVLAKYRGIHSK